MSHLSIISWNVNSVRVRLPLLFNLINQYKPDIVLLQELKCLDSFFPEEELFDMGFNSFVWGQKTYNGVAILSTSPIEAQHRGLNFPDHHHLCSQARYIQGFTHGITIGSVYVPNGQEVGSVAYQHKLEFYAQLNDHLKSFSHEKEEKIVLGGDFNVAPWDIDVYDPILWKEKILCSSLERDAFFSLMDAGFCDIGKHFNIQDYTWWDYRKGSFQKNQGLRIDHFLTTAVLANNCIDYQVIKEARTWLRPSDHAPILISLQTNS